jgi:hypothetical protein
MSLEFPHLKSLKVIVEERRQEKPPYAAGRGNWRTHEYSGLEAVPETLRPAFASPGTSATLDLLRLIREAYTGGRTEWQVAADYADGTGCDRTPVSRLITLRLAYRNPVPARAEAAVSSPAIRHSAAA